jgi:dethiobiotin synthase
VRPPTVPEGSARLRIACHAHNSTPATAALTARLAREPRAKGAITAQVARVRTLFVVGTDTDVGKTVVSALLARAAARTDNAAYWKPVQTGDASDTAEVERLAGDLVRCAKPAHELALPASPHTAARAEGLRIEVETLLAKLAAVRAECDGTLVVELAGGLLVPYDESATQADFLCSADGDVVLVARSGLGTLNHTLLTLEALAARGLGARALFLVGERHAANAETLRARTGLPLFEVERFERLDAHALDGWLARNDVGNLVR